MKRIIFTLLWVLSVVSVSYSQRTVSGTVTDVKGEALIGATVAVKGTSKGARADINGKYSVEIPTGATTLVVTYTGFETKEVTIGTSNIVDIVLVEGINLGEIIVTGTAVGTDKRKVPIDVQTVGSKALPLAPTASVDQALVGKIDRKSVV